MIPRPENGFARGAGEPRQETWFARGAGEPRQEIAFARATFKTLRSNINFLIFF